MILALWTISTLISVTRGTHLRIDPPLQNEVDRGSDMANVTSMSIQSHPLATCYFSEGAKRRLQKNDTYLATKRACSGFMYVPKHRLMFCGIEKNGVTALSKFSQALEGMQWRWYANSPSVFHKTSDQVESDLHNQTWRKIVILREPHARFLSGYLSKCGFTKTGLPGRKKWAEDHGTSCIHAHPGVDFETFVSLVQQKGFAGNPHFIPQTKFCFGLSQKLHSVWEPIILDKSTIHRDLQSKVCEHLGKQSSRTSCSERLNALYPIDRVSGSSRHLRDGAGHIYDYYTPSLWDKVSQLYADDIALFRAAGGPELKWQSVMKMDSSVDDYFIISDLED